MKQTRTAAILVVTVLIGLIVYASFRLTGPGRQKPSYTVSVIVEESNANRWQSFREGLKLGSQEASVVLNVVSTDSFDSLEGLTEVIRREQSSGVNGLIVSPSMDDENGILADALHSTPTVLVESPISGEQLIDTVSLDGYQMGSAIARQILKQEQITADTTIGVLSGNQRTRTMQQCLAGFLETLDVEEEQIQWMLSEQSLASADLLSMSMEAKPVDLMVALDNSAMETAITYLTGSKHRCLLYGTGRSEQCIYYLDQGLVQGLVVPDEFLMGYESITRLLNKLSTYSPSATSGEIPLLTVNRETLHDAGLAGVLFPAVR